jgi:hypothetical protein
MVSGGQQAQPLGRDDSTANDACRQERLLGVHQIVGSQKHDATSALAPILPLASVS